LKTIDSNKRIQASFICTNDYFCVVESGLNVIKEISKEDGLLWERLSVFSKFLKSQQCAIIHHTEEMQETFPLKHHIEGGLYTREIFMPKDNIVLSFIHKQDHPSFLLKGELSYINEKGNLEKISAPYTIFTTKGTQRIFYTHTDCKWACVYKVKSKTVEKAEEEIYTEDYRTLPISVINKNKKLWQV